MTAKGRDNDVSIFHHLLYIIILTILSKAKLKKKNQIHDYLNMRVLQNKPPGPGAFKGHQEIVSIPSL